MCVCVCVCVCVRAESSNQPQSFVHHEFMNTAYDFRGRPVNTDTGRGSSLISRTFARSALIARIVTWWDERHVDVLSAFGRGSLL